ncbi:MAG: hypothetical protein ACRD50_14115 [Candidatus Acidiferrales bacterium]
MPVVSSSAYAQAEDSLSLARALMNDAAGMVFTEAVLMPLLNSAYRGLQRELAENGVSVLTGDVQIALQLTNGLSAVSLSDTSSPQLPVDLLAPHELYEQVTGSTDLFIPMEKITDGLPNLQPSAYLRMWEWRGDQINLIGATQALTVRLRYERALPALVLGTDPVQIRSATDPLGYAVAAMAARSRGARALAVDLQGAAIGATAKLIERYVRPEQHKARRRKPYGYRRRIIYL